MLKYTLILPFHCMYWIHSFILILIFHLHVRLNRWKKLSRIFLEHIVQIKYFNQVCKQFVKTFYWNSKKYLILRLSRDYWLYNIAEFTLMKVGVGEKRVIMWKLLTTLFNYWYLGCERHLLQFRFYHLSDFFSFQ